MIRQIRFLKGECGWVNFPDGAIKLVAVNGNEVINVSIGSGIYKDQMARIRSTSLTRRFDA